MADKRKFSGSISVRIDTNRQKLELSPAPLHGGPDGFYRVRQARRWLDTADGKPRFFDHEGLGRLVMETFTGSASPAPAPCIPCPSRVSVRLWKDGMPHYVGTWTDTPPILDYSGRWVVCVGIDGKRVFVPCEDVIIRKRG